MSVYLLINIAIISVPLVLSFVPYFGFKKNFKPLFLSILTVGSAFVAWDVLATIRGDWSFNPLFVSEARFFSIPVEELLFFITVPFSCIFLYEGLERYLKEKNLPHEPKLFAAAGALLLFSAIMLSGARYTFIVLMVSGGVVLLGVRPFARIFSSRIYWIWMLCCTVLFMVFNYILTALPVVLYDPEAILNIRVLTIPIEDFFYNFSMLTLYLGAYLFFKKKS